MKTLRKTLIVAFLTFFFFNLNAQVENILKNALPEMYGNLRITPAKVYQKKDKTDYRNLFYKLNDAFDDVRQIEIGTATPETMLILDYKELKQIAKNEALDSLKSIVRIKQKEIINFMKFDERYGADSLNVGLYYNGFKDNFKNKKFDEAYKNWSILFHNYPLISSSIYSGGSSLIKYFIKTSKDTLIRNQYIDTLFQLYDQQIKVYPKKEAYIRGLISIDYYNLYIKNQDLQDTVVREHLYENYNLVMNAIKLGGNNTRYYIFPIAMKLTFFEYKLDSISSDQALDNYLTFSEILSELYNNEKNVKKQAKIKKGGVDLVDMIFSKSDLSTCDNLCPTFQTKFDRDSENISNLKTILTILGKKECTDCQLYSDVAVKLYELEPNSTSAHGVALLFASKEKYRDALKYMNEAIELETVDSIKATYYFEGAQIYNKLNSYSSGRDYARKAIQLKPDFGNAYILIATMYAASANAIGDDQFAHNAVYWAAVDKLNQAKNADPSVTDKANNFISTYSANFPKKEEGFMHSILEGNSYTVGGWIGEVTTARYYK